MYTNTGTTDATISLMPLPHSSRRICLCCLQEVNSNLFISTLRHVILPQDIAKHLPKERLLAEYEWRSVGVQQSRGWVHYAIHRPEPHILLFRREKGVTH